MQFSPDALLVHLPPGMSFDVIFPKIVVSIQSLVNFSFVWVVRCTCYCFLIVYITSVSRVLFIFLGCFLFSVVLLTDFVVFTQILGLITFSLMVNSLFMQGVDVLCGLSAYFCS